MVNMMDSCVICDAGRLAPGVTAMVIVRPGVTLVIRGVPALVCDNCGEAYLTADTTDAVGAQVAAAAGDRVALGVLDFAAA